MYYSSCHPFLCAAHTFCQWQISRSRDFLCILFCQLRHLFLCLSSFCVRNENIDGSISKTSTYDGVLLQRYLFSDNALTLLVVIGELLV